MPAVPSGAFQPSVPQPGDRGQCGVEDRGFDTHASLFREALEVNSRYGPDLVVHPVPHRAVIDQRDAELTPEVAQSAYEGVDRTARRGLRVDVDPNAKEPSEVQGARRSERDSVRSPRDQEVIDDVQASLDLGG